MTLRQIDAVNKVAGKVGLADGLAGGELTVAENEKRFARLYPCNLPGQRTKESGRPDDTETQ